VNGDADGNKKRERGNGDEEKSEKRTRRRRRRRAGNRNKSGANHLFVSRPQEHGLRRYMAIAIQHTTSAASGVA